MFDKVFDADTTQAGVWDYLSDSVSSFVKGYNVSILAYGQSGSGKSFTMGTSGPEDQSNTEIMGIVPRAAQAVFEKLNGTPTRQSGMQTPKRYSTQALPTLASLRQSGQWQVSAGKDWELKATYVEIYNEQLRDLLVPEHMPHSERAQVSIREDTKGRILLTGMTQVAINSVEDLLSALNFGSAIRQTDATAQNARSSRSHAVFTLSLTQRKVDGGPTSPMQAQDRRLSTMSMDAMHSTENVVTLDSKLHFVDLAGSERLKNTGATGDRAKEGISINAGLASLGKVISQLSSRHPSAHISYRDSRLTRLLQDSLGGNAITFMVACVTPATFHLNETLNTVHYAQRARAIQVRPELQLSNEDSDKQGVIERLRTEVAFLRDQVRHSEHGSVRPTDTDELKTRLRGREAELQSQLLDVQESHNQLSQRHAKLISELSKAREGEIDTPMLKEAIGANATERINRSSSFAEAVEQMVLEYEKTITSLESSLSKTRSTLSSSESTLMEKETRLAYMEQIQQQLQLRMQKAVDREQNNEHYLHDLETRMEGTTSSEERNASLIVELKSELARVKESETGAEDYISTLEERLAEAEQDQEIMQREIERLEHVVERQRSIGRLDNLLGELDSIRGNGDMRPTIAPAPSLHPEAPKLNGYRHSYDPFRPPSADEESGTGTHDDDFADAQTDLEDEADFVNVNHERPATSKSVRPVAVDVPAHNAQSATQNDFMADKLEYLSQELFDLRSEHETNLDDYDHLQQKYQTALETLAKLEYGKEAPKESSVTPAASRPESFLADAGMKAEEKATGGAVRGRPSSSRSLSVQSSLHGEQKNMPNGVEADTTDRQNSSDSLDQSVLDELAVQNDPAGAAVQHDVQKELETLRQMHAQKDVNVTELTKSYRSLAERHATTLRQLEDLKQEVSRGREYGPTSPSFSKAVSRRKSEDILQSDRTSRSFASLKNLALDNFENNPDTRQTFELNLNTVMTELHGKSERVHALEAELGTARKEMESKATIIAGLTRERSSLKAATASGVDFSIVGQLRDQLVESEHQIRQLLEQQSVREKEFQGQINSLKSTLSKDQDAATVDDSNDRAVSDEHMPGEFPTTPGLMDAQSKGLGISMFGARAAKAQRGDDHSGNMEKLEDELAAWEAKHHDALESMKQSEAKLLQTIATLEESMRQAGTGTRSVPSGGDAPDVAAVRDFDDERLQHKQVVDSLQREVDGYRSTADSHVTKLEQMEQSYAHILKQVDGDTQSRELTQKELRVHKDLVANLENQLQVHKSAITIHQESLESLQASHSKELEDLHASTTGAERKQWTVIWRWKSITDL